DEIHLLDTELADFLLAEILAFATRTAARSTRTTAAWAAFAARTTVPAAGSAMAARATFAARRSTVRLCLFRILCHTILPFSLEPEMRNSKNEMRKSSWPRFVRLRERVLEWKPALKRGRCDADAARRAVRAFHRASSGASGLRRDARLDT